MTPLNNKERSTAYWQALIFYLISSGLLILAIHFNYSLPGDIDALSKTQINEAAAFTAHREEIEMSVDSIARSIQRMGSANDPSTYQEQAGSDIVALRKISGNDSTLNGLLDKIANALDAWKTDKRDVYDAKRAIDNLKQQMATQQQTLDSWKARALQPSLAQ